MSASQLTLCCHVTALLRQSRLLGPHMSLLAALRHAVSLPEHLALLLTAGLRAAALQGGGGGGGGVHSFGSCCWPPPTGQVA